MVDEHMVERDLVEAHGLAHGARPLSFMKVCGLSRIALSVPTTISLLHPEIARAKAPAPSSMQGINGHESDIVAVASITGAGIAEADQKVHPSGSPRENGRSAGDARQPGSQKGGAARAPHSGRDQPSALPVPVMVTIVKSRSKPTGLAPSGSFTAEMWIEITDLGVRDIDFDVIRNLVSGTLNSTAC